MNHRLQVLGVVPCALAVLIAAGAGCTGTTGDAGGEAAVADSTPASLTVMSAYRQTGRAGEAVPDPPTVKVKSSSGKALSGVAVTFEVTAGDGAVSAGSATTGATGEASVAWTLGASGDQTLQASVAALPDAPVEFGALPLTSGAYKVDLRFLTSATDTQWAAFTAASLKISQVITGEVGSDDFDQGTGTSCGATQVTQTIDGLLILAEIAYIDGVGKVLGQSGPCWLRSSDHLPVVGLMEFDSADMDDMESDGTLDDVILHEMLHVVGFGTLWDSPSAIRALLSGAGGTSPTFTGASAVAAFQTYNGGASYSAVPVEGCSTAGTPAGCGEGTRDAHWTETIFDTELMTGWIDSGASHPLSATTIASLADLGYAVDLAQAEGFTIVSSTSGLRARARSSTSVSHHVGNDLLIIPLGVVEDRGARQR